MIRLNCVVEGQTEESFVNLVLAPEFAASGILAVAHQITTSRRRCRPIRGGFVDYAHIERDLRLWMQQDRSVDARFTTMIDLPAEFPGYDRARGIVNPIERARHLEASFRDAVNDRRFIPYIQVHEFEALLFVEPARLLDSFPDAENAVARLTAICNQARSPEHIDDGEETSPSKRIIREIPQYAKPSDGPITAGRIGLPRLRECCAHFNEWIESILALAA